MTLSLSSKMSVASTDGLLGLDLSACNPELLSSGLTTSRSSSVPAKPFGMDAVTDSEKPGSWANGDNTAPVAGGIFS